MTETPVDAPFPAALEDLYDLSVFSLEETSEGFTLFNRGGDPVGTIASKQPNLKTSPAIVRLSSFDTQAKDVLVKDWQSPNTPNVKLTNPSTIPSGTGGFVAWSPDGIYLAVASSAAPYVLIYKRSGDTFTKLSDPVGLPDFATTSMAWSPDGKYLAISGAVHIFLGGRTLTVFKRSGDVFTKLDAFDDLGLLTGKICGWSPDGNYLALGIAPYDTNDYPYLRIFKRTGDIFTKIKDPGFLPTSSVRSLSWSNNGLYLAVGVDSSTDSYLIYKQSGDSFTKLPDLVDPPTTNNRGLAWSPDDSYLVFAGYALPRVFIYKRAGDKFNRVPDPSVLPLNEPRGTQWSPDGRYLSIVNSSGSGLGNIYKLVNGIFQQVDVNVLSSEGPQDAKWSPDGKHLAVGLYDTPYLAIYKSAMGPVPGVAIRVVEE